MQNATPLVWLAENHPKVYQEYLEFRKAWRNELKREWWQANKPKPLRRPGRPRKNPRA